MVTEGTTASKVTSIVAVPVLPAASLAVTMIVLMPLVRGTDADHGEVPVALPAPPVARLVQDTPERPESPRSAAVPPSTIGARFVVQAPDPVGALIVTVGAWASRVTVMTSVLVPPALSVAVMVIALLP